MCFSAEADLLAGVVVGTVGVDALRHVRRPTEKTLALIPVVLAAHLLVEALVWGGLQGRLPDGLWRSAAWLYLIIAFGALPVLVPVAVGALEPAVNRRRVRILTGLGVGVAAVLVHAVVRGPVEASIQGHHIDYRVNLWHGGLIVALYLVVTCGSLLLSGHSHVRWFGVANLAAACMLAWLDQRAFISLWCAWAAVTSVAIAVHLRRSEAPPRMEFVVVSS